MRYYYETIREPTRQGTYGARNPGIWHVYDMRREIGQPVAVCYDRSDAEAIVKLFNVTAAAAE